MSILDMIFNEVAHTGFLGDQNFGYATLLVRKLEATCRELVDLIAQGLLSVPVEATYPLEDYKSAFEHAMAGERAGKVLFSFTG